MPTKKQHFVPRVYMKAWETTVETLKDPHIKFSGVYTFEDHTVLGNGANRNSVLWMPHLYTVRFQHNFVCRSCPRIMEDFVNQIYTIMRENGSKPIYAKIGYSVIRTKKSIRKHLHEIDDWTFESMTIDLSPGHFTTTSGRKLAFPSPFTLYCV